MSKKTRPYDARKKRRRLAALRQLRKRARAAGVPLDLFLGTIFHTLAKVSGGESGQRLATAGDRSLANYFTSTAKALVGKGSGK